MTLAAHEFIRRFLLHVLPQGFHRIRHYGLFANGGRAENLDRARRLLCVPTPQREPKAIVAGNSFKGGTRPLLRELARALREQRKLLKG